MAIGDDALAAGMSLVDGAATLASDIDREINRTRDYIAQRTSEVTPISKGGTGATTVAAARNALGLGSTSGAVPVANGGTGATTASAARTNLGVAASSHNHSASNITSGTLPQARGGTGASSASGARSALGVPAANGMSDVAVAQIDAGGGNNIGIYFNAGKPVIRVDVTDFPVPNINDVLHKSGGTMTGALYLDVAAPVTSSYVAMYRNGDGRVGVSPSALKFKRDITDHVYTVGDACNVRVRNYRLRADVFGSDDAPVEVGVIAEELIDAGLSEFVAFDDEGEPLSVHYERLALVALGAVQELAARVASLENRG